MYCYSRAVRVRRLPFDIGRTSNWRSNRPPSPSPGVSGAASARPTTSRRTRPAPPRPSPSVDRQKRRRPDRADRAVSAICAIWASCAICAVLRPSAAAASTRGGRAGPLRRRGDDDRRLDAAWNSPSTVLKRLLDDGSRRKQRQTAATIATMKCYFPCSRRLIIIFSQLEDAPTGLAWPGRAAGSRARSRHGRLWWRGLARWRGLASMAQPGWTGTAALPAASARGRRAGGSRARRPSAYNYNISTDAGGRASIGATWRVGCALSDRAWATSQEPPNDRHLTIDSTIDPQNGKMQSSWVGLPIPQSSRFKPTLLDMQILII